MPTNSPCLTCNRVRDPKNCENKTCRDWQAWFIHHWESMRDAVRKDRAKAQLLVEGVPLGGEYYASPHRVKTYLDTDPCTACPCGSCRVPCSVRKAWEEAKGVNK